MLEEFSKGKDNHYNIIAKDTYGSIVKKVEDTMSATKKTPTTQYRMVKRLNFYQLVIQEKVGNPRKTC